MDLSIVIPLLNEEESLPELTEWIERVCQEHKISYEIIYVDDGSTDSSWNIIEELQKKYSHIKAIRFQRNYGKSAALNTAFKETIGDVVMTMDADLQDNPEEIPEMMKYITEQGFDIVSGWKKKRNDPLEKRLPSKLYNGVVRWVSGIKLKDFNCGLKAYKPAVVKSIELSNGMHRYIPVLAKWAGFPKITQKAVLHNERKYGVSKFGWERYINGFLDLMTVTFTSKYGRRPMRFFGTWGFVISMFGFLMAFILIVRKLIFTYVDIPQFERIRLERITENPLFYIGLVALLLGAQLFLAGFLAEMIARSRKDRNKYIVSEKIGFKE